MLQIGGDTLEAKKLDLRFTVTRLKIVLMSL